MRICPNGHENPDNQHFCGECGLSIPPVEAASGAEWAADPTGRHEYRFWDGAAWSEHVADQGITSADPSSGAEQSPPPRSGGQLAPPPPIGAPPPVAAVTTSPPFAPAPVPEKRRSRKPWLVVVAVLVAVAAIAAGIVVVVGGSSTSNKPDPNAANLAACATARTQFQSWITKDSDAGDAQLAATHDFLSWYNSLAFLPSADSPALIAAIDTFNTEVAAAQAQQQAANQELAGYQTTVATCTVPNLPKACQTDFSLHPGLIDIANRHDAAVDASVNAIVTQQQALRAGNGDAANAATDAYNAAAAQHNATTTEWNTAGSSHLLAMASCDTALRTQ